MSSLTSIRYVTVGSFLLLAGCSHHAPQAIIEVIDTSSSITPRAEKAALDAVQLQIAHMQRGDRLVIIPITGDAANNTAGRVLRLSAPTERETYDADLRRFEEQAAKQFAAWASLLDPHQSRTDIIGTLDAAKQEFALLPTGMHRELIVASDFIEDDCTYSFVSATSLANSARARELAAQLREEHRFTMQGVPLCLGRLESSDFAVLSTPRKEAIQAFWSAYLTGGHPPAEVQLDGIGMLADTDHGCVGANR